MLPLPWNRPHRQLYDTSVFGQRDGFVAVRLEIAGQFYRPLPEGAIAGYRFAAAELAGVGRSIREGDRLFAVRALKGSRTMADRTVVRFGIQRRRRREKRYREKNYELFHEPPPFDLYVTRLRKWFNFMFLFFGRIIFIYAISRRLVIRKAVVPGWDKWTA